MPDLGLSRERTFDSFSVYRSVTTIAPSKCAQRSRVRCAPMQENLPDHHRRVAEADHHRRRGHVDRARCGQRDPRWRGSMVELDDLRAAARKSSMRIERIVGEGTQFCCVLVRSVDSATP